MTDPHGDSVSWRQLVAAPTTARRRKPPSVRRVVARFVAVSVLALVVLVLAGIWVSRNVARDLAIADAGRTADVLARSVVEPNVSDQLLTGDAGAVAHLDVVTRRRLFPQGLIRVKVWAPDGRILYSDEPQLIGRQYPLGDEEQAALGTPGAAQAELSELSGPENEFERALGGQLLEVYQRVDTPSGQPLLFEAYSRYDTITGRGSDIWRRFAPIPVAVLLLLQLLQLPLTWRMIGQIREAQRDRELLLHRAADASSDERRRIAAHLHDGAVQDLVGASLVLAGDLQQRPAGASEGEGGKQALTAVRDAIAGLRTLLVEIYPPSLAQAGLSAALEGVAGQLRVRGVAVQVEVPEEPLPEPVEGLFFRIGQEALRNIAKHAEATSVKLEIATVTDALGTRAVLTVSDDGHGFDFDGVAKARVAAGHFGLAVLLDLARSAGATLDLATAPGMGTRWRAEVPANADFHATGSTQPLT